MDKLFTKNRVLKLITFGGLGTGFYTLFRYTENKFASLLAMIFSVIFCAMVLAMLLEIYKPTSRRAKTISTLTYSLIKYIAAFVIICWGLTIFGVDISHIMTAAGVLALVVGFGAESLIADVITGTFMLFENQYNVGDIVEVNGFRGTVQEIGIRTTSIVDVGGNVKIINNADMKNILNRSNNASIAVSDIDIPYGTDLEEFETRFPDLMADIFARHRDIMTAKPVYLGVQALGASGITLRFTAEVPEDKIFVATRALNRELLVGFRKLGVECPFQQVDIHTR